MFRNLLLTGTAAFAAGLSSPALAQADPPAEPAQAAPAAASEGPQPHDPAAEPEPHEVAGADIIVTGMRRNRDDVLSGTSVVSGLELTRDLRPTIGETLSHQPGVSATSFGPNASRPVLRGFQGERVRVLTDGIGSLDVSSSSADHAVAINPLTAERIEVLRGPAALLFGSEAIGGVVNVVDARIPRRIPDEGAHVEGILTYGSASDERSGNAKLDVPVGGHFVVHADGNYSRSGDLRIGGYVLTPALRAEAAASADPAIRALAALKGRLPNTAAETSDVALGAAWIDSGDNVGFSVNRYDSLYGVPIRYALQPGEEAEAPRIDVKQTRADARAEFAVDGGLVESVRFRGGWSNYRHNELEENGDIGTTFRTKGEEARLEIVQRTRGGWGGGAGLQYFHRALNVVGAEKFLPPNDTSQYGAFVLQNYVRGPFRAEVGARYERQTLHAEADPDIGNPELRRTYGAGSGSIGGSYEVAKGVRLGVNASHTQRAPSGDELFADGPHGGTQAFEVGNPDLAKEKSSGLEGTLTLAGDGYGLSASVFRSWFSNYIYERRTGELRDGLPVFQISQAPARYSGIEMEANLRVADFGSWSLNLDAVADYIRATIRNVGPAPRIPPLRLLGGIEAKSDPVDARVEVERTARQARVASFETATEGFTLVNASVSWRPLRAHKEVSLTLSANNILDVDARRHASFLKDYAPLAGRDIRVTGRFAF